MNRLARFAGFGKEDEESADTGTLTQDVTVERMDPEALREPIVEALRGVHDPEIPINIYDLGLIYRIDISEQGNVAIDMTLTAPACPVAGMMPVMVKDAVSRVEGVGLVQVELVWDPPWTQEKMSDEARLQLGLM
ncbi:MAG: SUF system Fe-S cluster assembly protein [Thiocapsa sp.]|nr:SUF system Fe-S cluster assembly protein [Thiocapsa sp.]MCG6897263.1 SUF system Fe-S cluster assembly protein [Thiocapsa sp.]MCG6985419.1 SUF system Fe-S cluster assembly protein [Thiocapsa sp.]